MEQQPLYRWFFVLNRYHHAFIRKRLGGRSLEPRMMAVLHHIERGDGPSQEELSAHMGLDKTTVAHAVKSLVEKGYVLRNRDESDRRVYRLSLTDEGKSRIIVCKPAVAPAPAGNVGCKRLRSHDQQQRNGCDRFLHVTSHRPLAKN